MGLALSIDAIFGIHLLHVTSHQAILSNAFFSSLLREVFLFHLNKSSIWLKKSIIFCTKLLGQLISLFARYSQNEFANHSSANLFAYSSSFQLLYPSIQNCFFTSSIAWFNMFCNSVCICTSSSLPLLITSIIAWNTSCQYNVNSLFHFL